MGPKLRSAQAWFRASPRERDAVLDNSGRVRNQRIFEEVMREARAVKDNLAALLVTVRWKEQRTGRKKFGQLAGMASGVVLDLETPRRRFTHHESGKPNQEQTQLQTYTKLYQCWEKLGVTQQLREQLLDLLTPERDRGTVIGLYHQWKVRVGAQAFENASKHTNDEHRPLKYGTLWQRRVLGTVPAFREVRTIAEGLTFPEGEVARSRDVWSTDRRRQLEARGIERCLQQYLIALELADVDLDAVSLMRQGGFTQQVADMIASCELPSWAEIQATVPVLFPEKSTREQLEREWREAEAVSARRPTFEQLFVAARDARGLNNHLLALALKIEPPGEREGDSGGEGRRKEPYRISMEVRRTCQENAMNAVAPAGVLAALAARSAAGERKMKGAFCTTLSDRARRKGSALEDSPIRREREWWGIELPREGKLAGFRKGELQLIERGVTSVRSREQERILRTVASLGRTRAKEAQEELQRLLTPPKLETIESALAGIREYVGGYIPFGRRLKRAGQQVTARQLEKLAESGSISLPELKAAVHYGLSLEEDSKRWVDREWEEQHRSLILDWHRRFPDFLRREGWEDPLARSVLVTIHRRARNLRDFCQQHMVDRFPSSLLVRDLRRVNSGADLQWLTISRYLDAAQLATDHPVRRFQKLLFEQRAVSSSDALDATMDAWRKEMRGRRGVLAVNPRDYEYMLGLTEEEREQCGVSDSR